MSNVINIVFAVAVAFTIYGLLISVAHMPFFGAFFLVPLILCLAMFMFMDHSEGKREHAAHRN